MVHIDEEACGRACSGVNGLHPLPNEVDAPAEGVQPGGEGITGRVEAHGVHAGLAPGPQPGAHHVLGADQRGGQDHLVGDQGGRAVAVPGLPALADPGGDIRPALAAVGVVVEVGRGRPHAAQGEGQFLLPAGHRGGQVGLVDQVDLGALADVQVRPPAAGPGQPGVQVGEVGAGALGHEARAEPAVGDLTGQLQHPRRQRGQVHRHGHRRQADPHRLRPGQRDPVVGPGETDLLPGEHAPHDRDGLTHPGQRMTERNPVQPLHHLRPGYSQAEQEPAA